jgi:hypothetical protein
LVKKIEVSDAHIAEVIPHSGYDRKVITFRAGHRGRLRALSFQKVSGSIERKR